jgi:hypothetical protein
LRAASIRTELVAVGGGAAALAGSAKTAASAADALSASRLEYVLSRRARPLYFAASSVKNFSP